MDTDPGESTDYVEYPREKPFINGASKSELRQTHGFQSPQPTAIPETNSASIISALESLQSKIKELELNREKTLHQIEDVSRGIPTEVQPSSPTPQSPVASTPPPPTTPPPTPPPPTSRQSRSSSLHVARDDVLNLDVGEKMSKSPREKELKDLEEPLHSNPSTPRNIKEANQRSTAIGKRLEFMEREYGTLSSSLQNLRTMALMSAEKENTAGDGSTTSRKGLIDRSWKRRSADEGISALMAMQNLEKERASLKISQSLAEARIRALEKELESNRQKSAVEIKSPTELDTDQTRFPDVDDDTYRRLHGDGDGGTPLANCYGLGSARRIPDEAPLGECCTCDHPQSTGGARKGRERLCQMQNRLNQQRPTSKSPVRRSPGGRTTPDKGGSRGHYRLNMKHVPFVVGKSVTESHSLTANIQTLVAKMKSHDSGLCDHIRLLHENDASSPPPHHPPPPRTPDENAEKTTTTHDDDLAPVDPAVVADQLREIKPVLDALQDEFATMSFEHHELTNKLKALGIDDVSGDVRSASQDAVLDSLESQLGELVARMNVKGKQIKVLKKILKGLKENNSKTPASSKADRPKVKVCQRRKDKTRKSHGKAEVHLGKGQRVNVQDGIMVKCIPSTAQGARDLLYGIKDLHRSLKEADICWQ